MIQRRNLMAFCNSRATTLHHRWVGASVHLQCIVVLSTLPSMCKSINNTVLYLTNSDEMLNALDNKHDIDECACYYVKSTTACIAFVSVARVQLCVSAFSTVTGSLQDWERGVAICPTSMGCTEGRFAQFWHARLPPMLHKCLETLHKQ